MSLKIGTNPQVTIKPSQLPAEKLKENSSFLKSDTQALSNLNEKIISKNSSIQKTNEVDKTAEVKPETFKTNGGEWRTRDNVANDTPRFYRNGELTFDTKRVDTEFYKDDKTNQWVRLNGNGSLYNSPAYNGKEKPADVSDFQWQGWKVVADKDVPADYSTQGKTITLTAAENADPQSALRNYIKQNVIADGWTNDAATDEKAITRANELGIKVETEKIGVNEKGEPLYIVKISDEDLAKLRQVKAEWKKDKYEKLPTTTDDSKNEVNKISQDVSGLFYETGRKVIDGIVNGIPDLVNVFFTEGSKKEQGKTSDIVNVKLGNYESKSSKIEVPRLPTEKVIPKYEFQSRWARRDLNGVVDGDSFKLGETTSTVTSILAPIIVGKVFTPPTLPQSLGNLNISKVYRVQGGVLPKASKFRIFIGEKGEMVVTEKTKLFVTFDDLNRVKIFNGVNRAGKAEIISFEVDNSFVQKVRKFAVQERKAQQFPELPIISDPTKTGSSFGLPPTWIEKLKAASIRGSGKIEQFQPAKPAYELLPTITTTIRSEEQPK